MVRLNDPEKCNFGYVISMFQFQDGSIKCFVFMLLFSQDTLFQFQDGSIKCSNTE